MISFFIPLKAEVVINEFMALNVTAYPDMWDYDDFTDWIELYNIYTLIGRRLETLVDSEMKPGSHTVSWDARKYSSGIYLYKLKTNNFTRIMKASVR